MDFLLIQENGTKIAELSASNFVIKRVQDGVDLLGNLYYQDINKVIIYESNLTPDFFDLKTGIDGELLQKFSNYRVSLAIVGDFAKYNSKSLSAFILESNKYKHINFVSSKKEAIERLCSLKS